MADYKVRPEVTEHLPGMKIGGGYRPVRVLVTGTGRYACQTVIVTKTGMVI